MEETPVAQLHCSWDVLSGYCTTWPSQAIEPNTAAAVRKAAQAARVKLSMAVGTWIASLILNQFIGEFEEAFRSYKTGLNYSKLKSSIEWSKTIDRAYIVTYIQCSSSCVGGASAG